MASGGADHHDVQGLAAVVGVRKNYIGPFEGTVGGVNKFFTVDWAMAPVVQNAVRGICDGLMAANGAGTVGATDGMMAMWVAVAGA